MRINNACWSRYDDVKCEQNSYGRLQEARGEKSQCKKTSHANLWWAQEGSWEVCAGCNSIFYCSRECQVSHWKHHKAECKRLKSSSAGIKLNPPKTCSSSMSVLSGLTYKELYPIPTGVNPGEMFVVKVQGGGMMPIMVYDESRTCNFVIDYGAPGFKEVLSKIQKESAWNGRKTFMKASFDASGDCTI